MHPAYLVHLARKGSPNIHPKGINATEYLIEKLELKAGHTILELGCGTGETIVRIVSQFDVSIDGIDALDEMLTVARKRIKYSLLKKQIQLFKSDFNSPLPFESESYDRVYAESVLGFQNCEQIKFLLEEINRILKEKGLFVMNEAIWKKTTSMETIDEINASCIRDFGLGQASMDAMYLDDWLKLFEQSGFTVLSFENLDSEIVNKERKSTGRKNINLFLSGLITACYHLKEYVSSTGFKRARYYTQMLSNHKNDGKYIESVLFVLKKNR